MSRLQGTGLDSPAHERHLLAVDPAEPIGPGVSGYTVETAEAIYVPVVIADNPGSGDVSRWLDALPKTQTYRFPCVISPKLRGMLERRGFVEVLEWSEEFGEHVEVLERRAPPTLSYVGDV